jgi:predicted DNA binding CopG/RHH family protein
MAESKSKRRVNYIKSLDEIPRFESESAEAAYWSTHSLADIWDTLEPVQVEISPKARRLVLSRPKKKPVTIRLEEQQIRRAKQVARAKSQSYQALMRRWISEALDREERGVKGA